MYPAKRMQRGLKKTDKAHDAQSVQELAVSRTKNQMFPRIVLASHGIESKGVFTRGAGAHRTRMAVTETSTRKGGGKEVVQYRLV